MVRLSSFYLTIYKIFLIFIILINLIGILVIKLFLPKEQAITYDVKVSTILIIICGAALVICLNLKKVTFNRDNKIFYVKGLKKEFTISSNNVVDIKRKFIFLCEILYNNGGERKSIMFLPSIREFFPLLDYTQRIKNLLK